MSLDESIAIVMDTATQGGQVGSGVATPEEISRVLTLPLTLPLDVFSRINASIHRGGEVATGQVRVKWSPEPTVPSMPSQAGNRAYRGKTPVFPLPTEDFSAPRLSRPRPTPVPQRPREKRGPGARVFGTLGRGGEIVGEGRETSQHSPVRTNIF